MNRRYIALFLALMLMVLTGCVKQNETGETTMETTMETMGETTAPEESVPGIENSEFNDVTVPTETQTQPGTTEPAQTTVPTEASKPNESVQPNEKSQTEYETFQNMSASEQQAYMESFNSMDAFFAWYNRAKAEYEAANPPIDVGNGTVDMGGLID